MDPDNNKLATAGQKSGSGVLPAAAESKLKADAGAVVEEAKAGAAALKTEAEAQISAVADEAKAELGKVAEKAKGMAEEQKQFVSGHIEGVAEAVAKVAGELESNNATTAGYARQLADTVSSFSDTVKNKDVDELLAMAQDFGRRQPAVFMTAAALAGFAASRFILASAKRQQPAQAGTSQYGGTAVGDGGISGSGISGSYTGSSAAGGSTSARTTSTRDSMGGTI
jgi:hypothetical protein